jgi:hypothetical protein
MAPDATPSLASILGGEKRKRWDIPELTQGKRYFETSAERSADCATAAPGSVFGTTPGSGSK